MDRQSTAQLDHYFQFGDVYDALEACDDLANRLARLKRTHVLSESEWATTEGELTDIRGRLERHMAGSALTPKGPRLP
jgi:hypothetical protein